MVVDSNGKNFLRLFLSDNVLVKIGVDFFRCGQLSVQNRILLFGLFCFRLFTRSFRAGVLIVSFEILVAFQSFFNDSGVTSELFSTFFANVLISDVGLINFGILSLFGSAKRTDGSLFVIAHNFLKSLIRKINYFFLMICSERFLNTPSIIPYSTAWALLMKLSRSVSTAIFSMD